VPSTRPWAACSASFQSFAPAGGCSRMMASARGYAPFTCAHNLAPPASLSNPQWTAPLVSPSSICRRGNAPWPSFDRNWRYDLKFVLAPSYKRTGREELPFAAFGEVESSHGSNKGCDDRHKEIEHRAGFFPGRGA